MGTSLSIPVQALSQWSAVIGAANVKSSAPDVCAAATATFATHQEIPAILQPGSVSEVQDCVRIANEYRIPLYTISTGRNWGYGSKVPVQHAALMDLGRLNRIVDFDEELGYVTVEPGVTQRQLKDFLRDQNSKLWMDATGSGLETSLLGNVVERGFGHTPMADRFGQVCGLEVVLASGELIRTGFARFDNSQAAQVYRWGIGPILDGLFSQSNFGIVTRATLWLMPAPEKHAGVFFRIDEHSRLAALVDALRPLRMNGIIRSALHLANDYKVLAGLQQYPWDRTAGCTPLGPDLLRQITRELKFGAWNGVGGLYGTKGQVREAKRIVRQALGRAVDRLQFVDENLLDMAERFKGMYRLATGWDLTRTIELARPMLGLLRGTPTDQPLGSTYWRKRMSPPADMDPDRDRCGLLWTGPVAPMKGSHAVTVADLATKLMLDRGFEPLISITFLTERAIANVLSITYDRDIPGEDERAKACYNELLAQLTSKGYYPYRLGISSMRLTSSDPAYDSLLRTLKSTFDPNDILAPGRYQPSVANVGSN